jgi:hypothetical protein
VLFSRISVLLKSERPDLQWNSAAFAVLQAVFVRIIELIPTVPECSRVLTGSEILHTKEVLDLYPLRIQSVGFFGVG